MRQRRRTPRDPDWVTTVFVASLLACSAMLLWTTPVAASAGFGSGGFAPSGSMAALMGVLLAVAIKRKAR